MAAAESGNAWARTFATPLLGSIQSTLYWDQNTRMPRDGAPWRGEQLAWTATELHARQSSPFYADLLAEARQEWTEQTTDSGSAEALARGRNLDLLELDLRRQQAQDPQLIAALATAKSEGYACWQQARAASDFSLFSKALQRLIDLRQEQVRQLDEPRSCWETLAPLSLSLDRLRTLFAPLRQRLPELVAQATSGVRTRQLGWDLP